MTFPLESMGRRCVLGYRLEEQVKEVLGRKLPKNGETEEGSYDLRRLVSSKAEKASAAREGKKIGDPLKRRLVTLLEDPSEKRVHTLEASGNLPMKESRTLERVGNKLD